MNKIMVAVGMLFALSACNAGPEEQRFDMEKVQATLPDGCKLYYAGAVRVAGEDAQRPSRVFVTTCGDTVTTSQTNTVQNGKTTAEQNDVSVATSQ